MDLYKAWVWECPKGYEKELSYISPDNVDDFVDDDDKDSDYDDSAPRSEKRKRKSPAPLPNQKPPAQRKTKGIICAISAPITF